MATIKPTYVIGDVHGHRDALVRLLREDLGLLDGAERWRGADAHLIFVGDYVDRGPDSIGVLDLLMRLEQEASGAGGQIEALLGNHDLALLAAHRFNRSTETFPFLMMWRRMGGNMADLGKLTSAHVCWLATRPTLLRHTGVLLMHADAMFYMQYGEDVAQVNRAVHSIIHGGSAVAWMALIDDFTERFAFSTTSWHGEPQAGGVERARRILAHFGAEHLIHGHTPIFRMTHENPAHTRQPMVYADGLAVNVDAGIYRGSPGCVYTLVPSARQTS